MRALAFFKSPKGNLTLFLGLVAVCGVFVYRGQAREKAEGAQQSKVETVEPSTGREVIHRDAQPLALPASVKPSLAEDELPSKTAEQNGSRFGISRGSATETKTARPHPLPISLIGGSSEVAATPLSKTYAPYGRLIPCETVVTIESSRLETPVIGLVTEDVWHNGELIIPAGTEVHGRASLDRSRERIAVSGEWVVVWRDGSPLNGTELVLTGIALEREKDESSATFGPRDGSAGLVGQLVKTDDLQEVKMFAATFLGGFAGGLQQVQNQGTAFGGVSQVPIASTRNAALQGTADILNAYARQIQETIARDGFFVRVPAGKQFYLYVTETIDQAKGSRGNRRNEEIWKKNNAN